MRKNGCSISRSKRTSQPFRRNGAVSAAPRLASNARLARAFPDGIPERAAAGGPLFAEASPLRLVSAENSIVIGGGVALLLELAHPLVAAGVAQHSDYARDPLGRLQRTLGAISRIAFGSADEALAAAAAIDRAHRRVHGRLHCSPARRLGRYHDGHAYDARDPELLRWVWATLAWSSVEVYTLFVGPLEASTLERFYRDHQVIARLLGVDPAALPSDWSSFQIFFERSIDEDLAVGSEAREVAASVLAPALPLPGLGTLRRVTAALLPEGLRRAYGLRWDEAERGRVAELVESVRALRRR